MIVCGFVFIPPIMHKYFPTKLPVAMLELHETPRPLPEFEFHDGTGQNLTLDRFRGTFVLLNVWATWP
jgi:hypothetical protein